jgi:hypothetical protein
MRLTADQRERLCTALRSLHRMYGTWHAVADDMGCTKEALMKTFTGQCGSMAMVVAAAGLLRVPVERLLSGSLADADHCPSCGQRLPSIKRASCPTDSPPTTPNG